MTYIRVNVGCGYDHRDGFLNVDIDPACSPDQIEDVTMLSFPNESIDFIRCIEVLEHVSSPQRALEEMYRVLTNTGFAFISVPNVYQIRVMLRFLVKGTIEDNPATDHMQLFRYVELKRLCELIGFEIECFAYGWSQYHTKRWYEALLPRRIAGTSLYVWVFK